MTGVDGCRGGWIAVTVDDDSVQWQRLALDGLRSVIDAATDAVAVDIPIGLPDAEPRACDVTARRRLGARRFSVFPAPRRAVLDSPTYAEARQRLAGLGGPSMSAQAFGIVAAVRAADRALGPGDEARVIEVHPESSYFELAGRRDLPPKTTSDGLRERQWLISSWRSDAVASIGHGTPMVDALDALACAWSAQRWVGGSAIVLGDGSRDARGLIRRIVV